MVIVFATSGKGGAGRSVTSSNVAYRAALAGRDVCYLDFDFGAPPAGAMLGVHPASGRGLHSYFFGRASAPQRIDVWARTERRSLREPPPAAGRLVLMPGDDGGGEFPACAELVGRCISLLRRVEAEFEVCLVDLGPGRSYAAQMALSATLPSMFNTSMVRWLVHHRWTPQHITSAADLVYGAGGILAAGYHLGHDTDELRDRIRFVRTAVAGPATAALTAEQLAWLREYDHSLHRLAGELDVGRLVTAGTIPLDPVLQWREQLITDEDVFLHRIADQRTVEAFTELTDRLLEDDLWTGR